MITRAHFLWFALAVSIPLTVRADDDPAALRRRVNFDTGWRFHKGETASFKKSIDDAKIKDAVVAVNASFLAKDGKLEETALPTSVTDPAFANAVPYVQPEFDDASWQGLNLPHDWAISGPFEQALPGDTGKLPWEGVGWYRKRFAVAKADAGHKTFLDFEGAMSHATVWCNGRFAGGWPYGYASFRVDLTPFLKTGAENVLAVRLENPPESSRWYPGAGIYRHVWMVEPRRCTWPNGAERWKRRWWGWRKQCGSPVLMANWWKRRS